MRVPRSLGLVAIICLLALLSACTRQPEEPEPKASPAKTAAVEQQPQPVAIAGGTQIPDGPLIHVFPPGPEGTKLPVSGLALSGVNADPSTIGDYDGFSAIAYVVGEATGGDGKTYQLETDIRAFRGRYRAADGSMQMGLFAFI